VTSGAFPQAIGWNGSDWFSATTLAGTLGVRYLAVSCVPLTCMAVGYEPAPTRLPVAARYEYTDD
jgi:hypothetical protein